MPGSACASWPTTDLLEAAGERLLSVVTLYRDISFEIDDDALARSFRDVDPDLARLGVPADPARKPQPRHGGSGAFSVQSSGVRDADDASR
jgi:hypothetical protein